MAQDSKEHILVVDDDLLTIKTLKMILVSNGYEVTTALNGKDAQDIISQIGVSNLHCVLTDFRMPEISGLQLMHWVHDRDAALSTIILTGEGQKRLVQDALRAGASDYLEKPFGIHQITDAVARGVSNTHKNRTLNNTASNVRALGQVQQKLTHIAFEQIKAPSGKELSVSARSYPISETGGDFFNVVRTDDGKEIFVLVGDVSGHDLRAGHISAYFQGIARGMLEKKANISEINNFFNRYLSNEWNDTDENSPSIPTSLATTCLRANLSSHTLELHNHGMPVPIMANASETITEQDSIKRLGRTSPPLGWHESLTDESSTENIASAGYCYLWSDGLEDMAHALGLAPLSLAYHLHHEDDAEKRSQTVSRRKDDIISLRLDWQENDYQAPAEILIEDEYEGHRHHEIDAFQDYWEASLKLTLPNLSKDVLQSILLCLREGMLNAFKHGCQRQRDKYCWLRLTYEPNSNLIKARISDSGDGYNPHSLSGEPNNANEDTEAHISYGLILMRAHTHALNISEDGRTLELEFST